MGQRFGPTRSPGASRVRRVCRKSVLMHRTLKTDARVGRRRRPHLSPSLFYPTHLPSLFLRSIYVSIKLSNDSRTSRRGGGGAPAARRGLPQRRLRNARTRNKHLSRSSLSSAIAQSLAAPRYLTPTPPFLVAMLLEPPPPPFTSSSSSTRHKRLHPSQWTNSTGLPSSPSTPPPATDPTHMLPSRRLPSSGNHSPSSA